MNPLPVTTVWSYCDKSSLTWDAGCVWVLVYELHVLHQHLAAHAELVADGAAAGVGAAHHALVLLQQYTSWNKVTVKTIKYIYSLKIKYIHSNTWLKYLIFYVRELIDKIFHVDGYLNIYALE